MNRELNFCCEQMIAWTKEYVENPTDYIKTCFIHAIVREWPRLTESSGYLASEKAYDEFFDLTGKDIRDYDWRDTVKTKAGTKIQVSRIYMFEHLTTVYDFKETLVDLYKKNCLTLDTVAELISKQRICWITRDENKELVSRGYNKHRDDPYAAYKACGINIKEV